jgi:hypothetical protein
MFAYPLLILKIQIGASNLLWSSTYGFCIIPDVLSLSQVKTAEDTMKEDLNELVDEDEILKVLCEDATSPQDCKGIRRCQVTVVFPSGVLHISHQDIFPDTDSLIPPLLASFYVSLT